MFVFRKNCFVMAEKQFRVIEWKIENFSCWCEAVHGKCIVSPQILYYNSLFGNAELYPKGDSGQDDHMNVRFCDVIKAFTGELSFIGFDGSSICSQQVKITQKGGKVPGPSVGLKFEEVVAQIGKADQKDEITLRFCIQSEEHIEQRMCTTIGVLKEFFKIDPTLIENVGGYESKDILYFRYTSKVSEGIYLKIAQQDERIQLIMVPNAAVKTAVLVEICIRMLSSDNDLVRNEMVKHVFINRHAWIFSESLTVKELEEKGIIIHLRLKVVNGEIVLRYNYLINVNKVNILPNDSSLCFSEQIDKSPVPENQSDDSVTVLTKELMCLYQDQDFSDFQLKCGDVTFPVHRAILSARSPVFKTMLSCDMKEAASNEVDIKDLDPSTLGHFLTYLYTGAVEDLQVDRALKLYYAADKYQVPSLEKECVDFLRANVSMSNVCDILTLGDKHKNKDLLVVSHNFILNNFNELLGSIVWENFMENEPMLALKTVTYFAKKSYVGKMPIP